MAGELHVLALRLDRISEHHRWSRDFTLMSLERALAEVIAAFPVYRTYIERGTALREFDRNAVATAIQGARHSNPATNESIFSFIESVLLDATPEGAPEGDVAERVDFIRRFQQLTGPVMAKGLEDTASYRRYPLASFCEVGGNPDLPALLPREFHVANVERATLWPRSLSASATHDTKRGEDVRARLAVLSELPDLWFLKLGDWRAMNEVRRERLGGRPVPDANEEYFLYQTLVGTLPRGVAEAGVPEPYLRRIDRYMEKALREAKLHTSWISPNLSYEAAVRKFVRAILDPSHSFLRDLRPFVEIVAGPGFSNSLAQVILKITSPGIPDFYQGTEFMDFHLADPDNRDPVDYARRRSTLDSIRFFVTPEEVKRMVDSGDEDRLKMFVTRQALQCRRLHSRLFEEGTYRAIEPEGGGKDHVVAFSRTLEGEEVVVAVSHLPARPGGDRTPRLPAPASWDGTRLSLPEGLSGQYRDLLTGALLESPGTGGGFEVGTLFRILPVALLECVKAVKLAPATPSSRT
jgi:(1->4)-alpha-D-glucan 1-alpha-D-glucosylmutase